MRSCWKTSNPARQCNTESSYHDPDFDDGRNLTLLTIFRQRLKWYSTAKYCDIAHLADVLCWGVCRCAFGVQIPPRIVGAMAVLATAVMARQIRVSCVGDSITAGGVDNLYWPFFAPRPPRLMACSPLIHAHSCACLVCGPGVCSDTGGYPPKLQVTCDWTRACVLQCRPNKKRDDVRGGCVVPDDYQALLGSDYLVTNYGNSGRTMLKHGLCSSNESFVDCSYWDTDTYTAAMASTPDIVTIMLGTNDAKNFNWFNASTGNYTADAIEMARLFREV